MEDYVDCVCLLISICRRLVSPLVTELEDQQVTVWIPPEILVVPQAAGKASALVLQTSLPTTWFAPSLQQFT